MTQSLKNGEECLHRLQVWSWLSIIVFISYRGCEEMWGPTSAAGLDLVAHLHRLHQLPRLWRMVRNNIGFRFGLDCPSSYSSATEAVKNGEEQHRLQVWTWLPIWSTSLVFISYIGDCWEKERVTACCDLWFVSIWSRQRRLLCGQYKNVVDNLRRPNNFN